MDRKFSVKLLERKLISNKDSYKEAYHLVFESNSGSCQYLPGDSLGIWPKNNQNEIEFIINHLKLNKDFQLPTGNTLYNILSEVNCITHLPPLVIEHIKQNINVEDIEKWKVIASSRPVFYNELSLYEMLHLFPSYHTTEDFLIKNLKKLKPRLYSISSSPRVVGNNKIELSIVLVKYENSLANEKLGVATRYICKDSQIGDLMTAMVFNSHFKLPEDITRDVIMVGPGTGIAPFRAFLQERAALKQSDNTVGRNWLFFGGQHRKMNFYYKEELEQMIEVGNLSHLDLAFSRDQEERIYVQHRMLEQKQELWQWIYNGAYFYVCGDAKYMAKDVEKALLEIIHSEGQIDDPASYLEQMKSENRYQRDVY